MQGEGLCFSIAHAKLKVEKKLLKYAKMERCDGVCSHGQPLTTQ